MSWSRRRLPPFTSENSPCPNRLPVPVSPTSSHRSFGRGEITLASGRKSDLYFNLKPTMFNPEGAALLAELTFDALKDDRLD